MTQPATGAFSLAPATSDDLDAIFQFIKDLAAYEKLSDQVTATREKLAVTLFGPRPYAEVILARRDEQPIGFALYFHNYSTFRGAPGLYLEDLFVQPEHRGLGVGRALLRKLAQTAVERGCARIDWAVLNWNQPSIEFYQRIGAVPLDEWTTYRLTGEALTSLAKS